MRFSLGLGTLVVVALVCSQVAPGSTPERDKSFPVIGCASKGGVVREGPQTKRRIVALSFDDGPSRYTETVLRILRQYGAQATFFEIGRQVTLEMRPTLMRLLQDGNTIGNHTWDHPDLPYLSSNGIYNQLSDTSRQIRRITGFSPCLMRPPGGDYSASVQRTATNLRLRDVIWSIDPNDWRRPGADAIVSRVLHNIRPGRIILLHDGGGDRSETLSALPRILAVLDKRGYQVVTVEELIHASWISSSLMS